MSKDTDMSLMGGEWVYDETKRMAYKLDMKGVLIFKCLTEDVTEEEKREFTAEALINLGVDEDKSIEMASHIEPMQ